MNGCPSDLALNMPEGMARIAGQINSWKGDAVEYVKVDMETDTYETAIDGFYHFDVPMHEAYKITPVKDKNPLNGVSTFDLVLISKHILNIQPFHSPYQWIAADANGSNTVTAFDMVQLRRLILAMDKDFKNNTSWRFIPADYDFTSANPLTEDFEEFYQIDSLSKNLLMNFIAVKIGDVNGNAKPNSLYTSEVRSSKEVFQMEVVDQLLKAGETYNITFSTKQLAQIQGYQFTLQLDDIQVEQVTEGIMHLNHFGLQGLDKGQITASWNQETVDGRQWTVDGSENLFTLQLVALQDVALSEILSIGESPTAVEAYDNTGKIMDIQLAFTTSSTMDSFELYQNAPNPFKETTHIKYSLPGDSEVQLVLRDETGRVLEVIRKDGKAGRNEIRLEEMKQTTGFIYYQLITKFGTKSRKMLQVK